MVAFAEFAFIKILNVCFQVVLIGCTAPDEFLGLILISFIIGMLVQIILVLTKKGVKFMKNIFYTPLNRGQKPEVRNEKQNEAKVGIEWV